MKTKFVIAVMLFTIVAVSSSAGGRNLLIYPGEKVTIDVEYHGGREKVTIIRSNHDNYEHKHFNSVYGPQPETFSYTNSGNKPMAFTIETAFKEVSTGNHAFLACEENVIEQRVDTATHTKYLTIGIGQGDGSFNTEIIYIVIHNYSGKEEKKLKQN